MARQWLHSRHRHHPMFRRVAPTLGWAPPCVQVEQGGKTITADFLCKSSAVDGRLLHGGAGAIRLLSSRLHHTGIRAQNESDPRLCSTRFVGSLGNYSEANGANAGWFLSEQNTNGCDIPTARAPEPCALHHFCQAASPRPQLPSPSRGSLKPTAQCPNRMVRAACSEWVAPAQ